MESSIIKYSPLPTVHLFLLEMGFCETEGFDIYTPCTHILIRHNLSGPNRNKLVKKLKTPRLVFKFSIDLRSSQIH